MKVIVTGSLGHISLPLTKQLVQKGYTVTVVSSKPDRQQEIEALGATAAIGSVQDVDFLTATFTGADAVYAMAPPPNYIDRDVDLEAYCKAISENYAHAIERSGVKHVVYLSSIGAHLAQGSGLIIMHHNAEVILSKLSGVSITFMRPVGFYYNLFSFLAPIKHAGVITANYGADEDLVWVSPTDIADAVAEELDAPHTGIKVRYVASDELTGHQTASILGQAIGKPDLKWVLVSDEERLNTLLSVGLNPEIAAGLVEMFSAQHSGLLMEDYYHNKPKLGKIKLVDFAQEFATVYNQN